MPKQQYEEQAQKAAKDVEAKAESVKKDAQKEAKNLSEKVKKELPTSDEIDSFFEKIRKTIVSLSSSTSNTISSVLGSTSKSLVAVYQKSLSIIQLSASKSIDFTKYYYSSASTKVSQNPLITYDALYLTTCSVLGGVAYTYHRDFLTKKMCEHCHHTNNTLHLATAVGVCLSILGVGNYLYLKKPGTKKA
ncbi:hypothetical protein PMKS-002635 [Pichia membranifaciens]|uniref:Uncharacterized protein n=1 Tax=Pichia membranifaciens TaxID=4926 RepID=A0A1Q2YI10_9ASCO|nr:hypothetical protein PMKS-002635 [Pichia membranifaciens]